MAQLNLRARLQAFDRSLTASELLPEDQNRRVFGTRSAVRADLIDLVESLARPCDERHIGE